MSISIHVMYLFTSVFAFTHNSANCYIYIYTPSPILYLHLFLLMFTPLIVHDHVYIRFCINYRKYSITTSIYISFCNNFNHICLTYIFFTYPVMIFVIYTYFCQFLHHYLYPVFIHHRSCSCLHTILYLLP